MNRQEILNWFHGKSGIEIGGLSRIFQADGMLPIYNIIGNLDGCNFAQETLWESGLTEGSNYKFIEGKAGYQYINEATTISHRVPSEKYDFVISSNCLEHIANPLKALGEFLTVVKLEGMILIVVPKKEATFDHKRAITTFDHINRDYIINNIQEDDLTHLDEILSLHDLALDPPAGDIEQFKSRSFKNYFNRGLHHHVFNIDLLVEMFVSFNIQVIYTEDIGSDYIIVGQKVCDL